MIEESGLGMKVFLMDKEMVNIFLNFIKFGLL